MKRCGTCGHVFLVPDRCHVQMGNILMGKDYCDCPECDTIKAEGDKADE